MSSSTRAERAVEDELSACCTRFGELESETESLPGVLSVVENLDAPAPAAGAGASKFSTTDSTPGSDSVSLSNSPNLVQQALNSSSTARSARVEELKALVQSNQYQPNAQEVAGALIGAHLTGA